MRRSTLTWTASGFRVPGRISSSDFARARSRLTAKSSEPGFVEGLEDLLGLGAAAVVGVHVNPPDEVVAIENQRCGHRKSDSSVLVEGRAAPAARRRGTRTN